MELSKEQKQKSHSGVGSINSISKLLSGDVKETAFLSVITTCAKVAKNTTQQKFIISHTNTYLTNLLKIWYHYAMDATKESLLKTEKRKQSQRTSLCVKSAGYLIKTKSIWLCSI